MVVAALLAVGCASAPAARPRTGQPVIVTRGVAAVEPAADPRPYGAADTAFGLNVLSAWCRADPRANLVFSPSALATGLGMAYLGARGDTARAMARVLRLPAAAGQALEAGLQARWAALRGLDGPGVTLAAADQIWADPSLLTLRSYLNALATGYGTTGVNQVPLLTDPQRAADRIDQSIADATRGQIPRLVSGDMLQGIGWVLTAALYMHAAWATPFDASETQRGAFTTAAGRPVTAQFMDGHGLRAATAGGWTAVRLPYQGGKLAMTALLPASATASCPAPTAAALAAMTGKLAAGGFARWAGGAGSASILLPKVRLSSAGGMKALLTRLGMGLAFSQSADFSGLSPEADCIRLVQQAATLDVGEKGTVASAAVAVGVMPTAGFAGPIISFNRPYLLLVTDTATGEPLFLARVANPAAS